MDSERLPGSAAWRRPVLVAGVLLAALAAAAVVLGKHAARQDRLRKAVVDEVLGGKLRPSAAGVVALPREFASTSIDGRVYVTRWPDGRTCVLFPAWRGQASSLRGFLFTSAAYCCEAAEPAEAGGQPPIEVIGPAGPSAGLCVKIEVFIERRLDRHWLLVSRQSS